METAKSSDRSLGGIVAILVSLAVLAERAAGRSFPVRWVVLVLLRRAEAVVSDFVSGAMPYEWPCLGEAEETGNDPADAILLAARLRALAAVVAALMPPAPRFPRRGGPVESALARSAPLPGRLAVTFGGVTGGPNDTS
jgi:hypothetical protein